MARRDLRRFEVYVRVAADGLWLSMRVPDIHAVDGKEALRLARRIYGDRSAVRGIRAVEA